MFRILTSGLPKVLIQIVICISSMHVVVQQQDMHFFFDHGVVFSESKSVLETNAKIFSSPPLHAWVMGLLRSSLTACVCRQFQHAFIIGVAGRRRVAMRLSGNTFYNFMLFTNYVCIIFMLLQNKYHYH